MLEGVGKKPEVFGPLGYEPTPRQLLFHDAPEFDVFYGGAAGGGKTKALVMEAIRACIWYPGIRVGVFRRSFPELEESVIAELAKVNFAAELGGKWDKVKHDLRFPNRSVLMCRYLRTIEDFTRRQGGEFQLICIDERTLMAPDVIRLIESRLRSGSKDIPVIGVRSAGNPGGASHGEMKARYVEATERGTKTYEDERGRLVRFIPARVDDNPHLNPEYEKDLEALPPAMRRAFRDGDWDSFVGQVFEEWNYERHVVPRFQIPPEWRQVVGIDWGYAAPWCVLWVAADGDGRAYVFRERYQRKVGETDQANRILADEAGKHCVRYADPSMWRSTGEGPTIAETYAKCGVALTAANNERLAGWQRVHHYLAEAPACFHHRQLGWATCPKLHVLEGAAPNLVRTLPTLPFDRRHPEDVDTDAEDHAADALRYLLMGLGAGASSMWFAPDRKAEVTRDVPVASAPFIIIPRRASW